MSRLLFLFALTLAAAYAADQPIPYSHKTHLALGLKCKDCHANPDPGEVMGFPATSKCMACHTTIKADSPAIQKLAAYAKDKQPVPWVRVYQIPGYVIFSHRVHTQADVTCQTCHGEVAQRDVMVKEVAHNMGSCMACHQERKVSNDCSLCHELKQ